MGVAQCQVTDADLVRLLWLREGITVDVIVWDPLRRTATLLVSGSGVDVEVPPVGAEPDMITIEQLMTRIPFELGEGDYGEGVNTFAPPIDPTFDEDERRMSGMSKKLRVLAVPAHPVVVDVDPLLKRDRDADCEAAVCPVCGGGLACRERASIRRVGANVSFYGVVLRCVDCGHRAVADGWEIDQAVGLDGGR